MAIEFDIFISRPYSIEALCERTDYYFWELLNCRKEFPIEPYLLEGGREIPISSRYSAQDYKKKRRKENMGEDLFVFKASSYGASTLIESADVSFYSSSSTRKGGNRQASLALASAAAVAVSDIGHGRISDNLGLWTELDQTIAGSYLFTLLRTKHPQPSAEAAFASFAFVP